MADQGYVDSEYMDWCPTCGRAVVYLSPSGEEGCVYHGPVPKRPKPAPKKKEAINPNGKALKRKRVQL